MNCTLLLLCPCIGIFNILFISSTSYLLIKRVSLFFSILTFYISLFLWIFFENNSLFFQFIQSYKWFSFLGVSFVLGIDGISLFFIILTTFLIPICLLISWKTVYKKIKLFFLLFLILELCLLFIFLVLDLLLFYIFFESVLIPMFLIIGIWGSRECKIKAGYYFFIYTLFGSLIMLLGILFIWTETGTTNFLSLTSYTFTFKKQILLWLMFFISLAIKVPVIPFHIWLPEAHVEAPTVGSVILAGILLKLGFYGFIRFSFILFPQATIYFTPFIYTLSLISLFYSSLTTLRQIDLKRIIAYSSVAHMNFCLLGLFSVNIQGIVGSVFLSLSHGFVSSALFLCVGVLYDRHHTRLIKYYSGLTLVMPIFSFVFLLFSLSNLGLPGTSSFVGEFLILIGIFKKNYFISCLSTFVILLGSLYSIWLYNRLCFGNLKLQYNSCYYDINKREFFAFIPLLLVVILTGVYPSIIIDSLYASVYCFVL